MRLTVSSKVYDEDRMKRKLSALPVITIFILITIICIVMIAKKSLYIKEDLSMPVMLISSEVQDDYGLNQDETKVLMMLSQAMDLSDHRKNHETKQQAFLYLNNLKQYFKKPEISLTSDKAEKMGALIENLGAIMKLEINKDFNEMSLDGREIAIYISRQIYEACGLELVFNTEGKIEQILDPAGREIYYGSYSLKGEQIYMEALFISLLIIILLLCICFIVARKNQLFVKDVIYDGFDEERYA